MLLLIALANGAPIVATGLDQIPESLLPALTASIPAFTPKLPN